MQGNYYLPKRSVREAEGEERLSLREFRKQQIARVKAMEGPANWNLPLPLDEGDKELRRLKKQGQPVVNWGASW